MSSDQGVAGGAREPGGAAKTVVPVGAEEGGSQVGANWSLNRGGMMGLPEPGDHCAEAEQETGRPKVDRLPGAMVCSVLFTSLCIVAGSGSLSAVGSGIHSVQCVVAGWLGFGSGVGLVMTSTGQIMNQIHNASGPLFTSTHSTNAAKSSLRPFT